MMGKLKACAVLVLVLAVSSCQRPPRPAVAPAQVPASSLTRLQHDIDATLAAPELVRTSWGVLVRSLGREETLYGLNPNKLLMPSSNMKIVTLAAAAERLGWDYTYETRLLGVGAIGSGTLDGDLLVVGSGDPSITSHDGFSAKLFGDWAE